MNNNNRDHKDKHFESYPRPTQTDTQLKNQPEFIEDDKEETKDPEINKTSANEESKREDHSNNDE